VYPVLRTFVLTEMYGLRRLHLFLELYPKQQGYARDRGCDKAAQASSQRSGLFIAWLDDARQITAPWALVNDQPRLVQRLRPWTGQKNCAAARTMPAISQTWMKTAGRQAARKRSHEPLATLSHRALCVERYRPVMPFRESLNGLVALVWGYVLRAAEFQNPFATSATA
jgi:hypothetical protein